MDASGDGENAFSANAAGLGLDETVAPGLYLEAVDWAQRSLAQTGKAG